MMKNKMFLRIICGLTCIALTGCASPKTESAKQDASSVDYYPIDEAPAAKAEAATEAAAPEYDDSLAIPAEGNYAAKERYRENSVFQPDYSDNSRYEGSVENGFQNTLSSPLSTASIDVDTASFSNVRRYLLDGQIPPIEAIRIEELVNYFDYDYPAPKDGRPFSVITEINPCPWEPEHYLAKIALKGVEMDTRTMQAQNLVFLVDVSGSMSGTDRLPALVEGLRILTKQLGSMDTISIVTYANGVNVPLHGATGAEKDKILRALDSLEAGGGTNGQAGIQEAYRAAQAYFIKNGSNRVILCTDGDFNVGMTDDASLEEFIAGKKDTGVYLSIIGFGRDNLNDAMMKKLSIAGAGNYFYADSQQEIEKILIKDLPGTLNVIAEDVKFQVEFNPEIVVEYRLIGYEKREMRSQDFKNDNVDAGEFGAGDSVTIFYEIIPASTTGGRGGEKLKYQPDRTVPTEGDFFTVKLRYKDPGKDKSKLFEHVADSDAFSNRMTAETAFASAVVEFGLLLQNSAYKGIASYENVFDRAQKSMTSENAESGFLEMISVAEAIDSSTRR